MADAVTHAEVSRIALGWLMAKAWCATGAVEVACAYARLDAVAVSACGFEPQLYRSERAMEVESAVAGKRRIKFGTSSPPKAKRPTIAIVEAKATRSDLLSDLRAEKMHTYGPLATHGYLFVGPDVIREADMDRLPPLWGVYEIQHGYPVQLRRGRRLRESTYEEVAGWTSRIARAAAWRLHRNKLNERE